MAEVGSIHNTYPSYLRFPAGCILEKDRPWIVSKGLYSEAINLGTTTISRVSSLDGERRICVNTVNCFHSCGLGGERERKFVDIW